jgi:c-di-GMP-binding flagellar brake protein YcgR
MGSAFDSERREFVRIKVALPVRYKFLSHDFGDEAVASQIHEGSTNNISGGGLLLRGRIPDLQWIPSLLMQRIVIGVNLHFPNDEMPLKALTRVAWIESLEEGTQKCSLGLRFHEIGREDEDRILQYIIRCQMPG